MSLFRKLWVLAWTENTFMSGDGAVAGCVIAALIIWFPTGWVILFCLVLGGVFYESCYWMYRGVKWYCNRPKHEPPPPIPVAEIAPPLPPPAAPPPTTEELFAKMEEEFHAEVERIRKLPLDAEELKVAMEDARIRFLRKVESLM